MEFGIEEITELYGRKNRPWFSAVKSENRDLINVLESHGP